MHYFLSGLPQPAIMAIGALLFALGCSYLYKGWNALILGRCHYWSGFLPFTVISPWLLHFPPKQGSLVKLREGMLCHMVIGPLFFITSFFFLIPGLDMVAGGAGTKFANLVLNAADSTKPTAMIYSPPLNYKFPILARAGKTWGKLFNMKIYEDPSHSLLPGDQTKSLDQAQNDAAKGHN